jgi:hypothetical protein
MVPTQMRGDFRQIPPVIKQGRRDETIDEANNHIMSAMEGELREFLSQDSIIDKED